MSILIGLRQQGVSRFGCVSRDLAAGCVKIWLRIEGFDSKVWQDLVASVSILFTIGPHMSSLGSGCTGDL